MDSHPKVMTVSYGTFSCTLDGFDDPFTTMQLVAEYFRKLSADDRCFGSEPLQPDATRLHQIAKNANTNRIDAEVQDNSVILRQADVVDVPSKVNDITNEAVTHLTTEDEKPQEVASFSSVLEDETEKDRDTVDDSVAAFSSRRKQDPVDIVVDPIIAEQETPAKEAPQPEVKKDVLTSSLEDNINDTTTADELAPSLDEEIPSETVSAAVKALKGSKPIDRWLEIANEKMAAPAHITKANALERLKAAVAATEAERATRMEKVVPEVVETGEERRDNTISFRRELAKVRKAYEQETSVFSRPRSRRAAADSTSSSARPLVLDMGQRISESDQNDGVKKKSGLTLVSDKKTEQPIKTEKSSGFAEKQKKLTRSEPVKKTAKATVVPEEKTKGSGASSNLPSFEDFSRLMGASTLIELLEASAAYMSVVLGKDHYSEKQISSNLPPHIKRIVKEDERVGTLERLNKRGFIEARNDGSYVISMGRKAAYQKKYLAG